MCFCVFLDSERSHLSSFTMKLKGKFHSPKIKRTPSKKGKQADLTVKTPEKSANKVSKWRASSPRLAGFLLSVTQVLRSTASLSVCDFVLCRSLQICQGTSRCLMVSFKLCYVVYSKRCIFFLSCWWGLLPSLFKYLITECSLMPDTSFQHARPMIMLTAPS